MTPTRRIFLLTAGAAAPIAQAATAATSVKGGASLDGTWEFRLDASEHWREVRVPHTWQVEAATANYLGPAWYRREFDARAEWAAGCVRVEFEAVFHSATVWVNGRLVGAHLGKGYTAFEFDITGALKFGARNTILVRVDNSFRADMLPRDSSYDWTPDGGIYRPVRLLATPQVYIERVEVDAMPDLAAATAALDVRVVVRNASRQAAPVNARIAVSQDWSGLAIPAAGQATVTVPAGETREILIRARLDQPRLWHFDHPHLYRLEARIEGHSLATTFGVRRFEVRDTRFYLNGEPVRLMGVERMAGSHPEFGMAEPSSWIEHDQNDMKELNCVFTRVHWQQDRRVLDYCDRHGILIQLEVPSWGGGTFKGMTDAPSAEIMRNGLEQLREMIARDRNHPSVFAWGLCNEVNGQNPPAQQFVRAMRDEARKLDPHRLLTYASNSLQTTPERDVVGELDFISWNEYYESWYKGDPAALRRNLETIRRAFPGKPVVISEYGYCECTSDRHGGDPARARILCEHDAIFREFPFVGGLIFFSYNDYRTHIGDKGLGVMKQRVHGVVDLYGSRKPSFEELRNESSPVERMDVTGSASSLSITIRTRNTVPAYTMDGYTLRWVVYGFGGLPMEMGEAALPKLTPGMEHTASIRFREPKPHSVRVDVVRPTGFSVRTGRIEFA